MAVFTAFVRYSCHGVICYSCYVVVGKKKILNPETIDHGFLDDENNQISLFVVPFVYK